MHRLLPWLLLFVATVPLVGADLTIVGSDLLGDNFPVGLKAYAARQAVTVKLNLAGSRAGRDELVAGRADLALLVFSAGETPPAAPFVARPVAYFTAMVVVPASLPLEQVSYNQLRDLYADSEGASLYVRWSDFGIKDPRWSAAKIFLGMSGPGGGLSYDIFRYTVLPGPGLRPGIKVDLDGPAALKRIDVAEGGLTIVPALPAAMTSLRVVPVSRGIHDVGFLPTPENVHTGDYPIRLPLYVVFRADATKKVLPLLRYLYDDEALPSWRGAQLVPLPTQAREVQMQDFAAP